MSEHIKASDCFYIKTMDGSWEPIKEIAELPIDTFAINDVKNIT